MKNIIIYVLIVFASLFVLAVNVNSSPIPVKGSNIKAIYDLSNNKKSLDKKWAAAKMKELEQSPQELLHTSDELSFIEQIQYLTMIQEKYPDLLDKEKEGFFTRVAASAQLQKINLISEKLKEVKDEISSQELKEKYYPVLFSEIETLKEKYSGTWTLDMGHRYDAIGKAGALALDLQAQAYIELGDTNKAIESYRGIISSYPDSNEIYYEGGAFSDVLAYNSIKELVINEVKPNLANELKLIDSILQISKGNKLRTNLYFRKAEIFEQSGKYSEALGIYQLLIEEYKIHKYEYPEYHEYVPVTAFQKGVALSYNKFGETKTQEFIKKVSNDIRKDQLLLQFFSSYLDAKTSALSNILKISKIPEDYIFNFSSAQKDGIDYFLINNSDLVVIKQNSQKLVKLDECFGVNTGQGYFLFSWLDDIKKKLNILVISKDGNALKVFQNDLQPGFTKEYLSSFQCQYFVGDGTNFETNSSRYSFLGSSLTEAYFFYSGSIYAINFPDFRVENKLGPIENGDYYKSIHFSLLNDKREIYFLKGNEIKIYDQAFHEKSTISLNSNAYYFLVSKNGKIIVTYHTYPKREISIYQNDKLSNVVTLEGNVIDVTFSKNYDKLLILYQLPEYDDQKIENMPAFVAIYNLASNREERKFMTGCSPTIVGYTGRKNTYYLVGSRAAYFIDIE